MSYNICIVGSGNLAFHLSKSLEQAGFNITQVYSRSLSKAEKLSYLLYNAKPTNDPDFSASSASVFFLCVSDQVIREVAQKIVVPSNSMVIHCSGATPLAEIETVHQNAGVFYPVQTFSTDRKVSFKGIPVCIEATSEQWESQLEKIAKKLNASPFFMNSEQRLTLHAAAVFSCNFSNYLFSVSKRLLEKEGLPFGLLHSLIAETVQKALEKDPVSVQTGPAVRNDLSTMQKHEQLLHQDTDWLEVYRLLSAGIIKNKESH